MTISIELTKKQVEVLDTLAKKHTCSREDLLHKVIIDNLEHYHVERFNHAFGLWQEREIDGLRYQKSICGE